MPTKRSISQARYDAARTKHYSLKLNARTDAELIAKIEKEGSAQAYIKRLIREDIRKEKENDESISD